MFGSKKRANTKEFEERTGRFLTGSTLLKSAMAGDRDTMLAVLIGGAATDDQLVFVLRTFVRVAHRYPEVVEGFRELMGNVDTESVDDAGRADRGDFDRAVLAVELGDETLRLSTVVTRGMVISCLAQAIASADVPAVPDAMAELAGI